jgi:collagenase-like PrtC family protease
MQEKMQEKITKISADSPLPELLAPAGSPEALAAALRAGADAVYLGSTQFGARAFAKNFDRPALKQAVEDAHAAGVRVYLTVNTLITDRMMRAAMDLVAYAYEVGVDALIVADWGLAKLCRENYPDFPLHASTQCSGHNADAARWLEGQGFSMMVAARELSADNLRKLTKDSPIPIEVFVHGALCVSASGQCLFSSLVGGRSGNRGECAQPCRMQYNNKSPLSLKDLSLAMHIPELIEIGVASLKIEGRMKSPDYVYRVVSIYRRLLDERRAAAPAEMRALEEAFSRQGFTDGYFVGKTADMNGVRSEADKSATAKAAGSLKQHTNVRKEPLPPIVLPGRMPHAPILPPLPKSPKSVIKPSARFYKPDTIPTEHKLEVVYLPLEKFDGNVANGVLLPPVIPDGELEKVEKALSHAKDAGARHVMVGNVGQIALAKRSGLTIHGDFRLNLQNSYATEVFADFADLLLSPELLLAQMRDIPAKKAAIVYGRVPLMLLEKSCGTTRLSDRMKKNFPVISEGGRELVLNSLPIYMADKQSLLSPVGVGYHYIFTQEGPQEVKVTLSSYDRSLPTKKEVRRMK